MVEKLVFKCSELKSLMQLKSEEAVAKLNEAFGGIQGLAAKLKTSLNDGLDGRDLSERVNAFGKNEIPPKPPKSFLALAIGALHDPTLVMLMICSLISIGLSFYNPPLENKTTSTTSTTTIANITNVESKASESEQETNLEWIEGVAILVAVIVVVFVTAFNDWRKEKQFRGLKEQIERDNRASVIRRGQIVQVALSELVVGDICCIKYGDLIPADGVLVQSSDLKVDESSLTGETDQIKKNTANNVILLSGTQVMEGSGRFMVIAVGLNSQTGIIMSLLGATEGGEDSESIKCKISKYSF